MKVVYSALDPQGDFEKWLNKEMEDFDFTVAARFLL